MIRPLLFHSFFQEVAKARGHMNVSDGSNFKNIAQSVALVEDTLALARKKEATAHRGKKRKRQAPQQIGEEVSLSMRVPFCYSCTI